MFPNESSSAIESPSFDLGGIVRDPEPQLIIVASEIVDLPNDVDDFVNWGTMQGSMELCRRKCVKCAAD
jgi:hypothetical protein